MNDQRWAWVRNTADAEETDNRVGDRGMNNLDASIFAEVMARMQDKARDAYVSGGFIDDKMNEHNRRESIMWANANRFVNL